MKALAIEIQLELGVNAVGFGFCVKPQFLDLIHRAEIRGEVHALIMGGSPCVAVNLAGEFFEVNLNDSEAEDFEVGRGLVDLLSD